MNVTLPLITEQQVIRVIRVTFIVSLPLLFFGTATYFSPDAWTAYELANTIGGDFYRENTAREYFTGNLYSSAFPPLWPLIIALFTPLTHNIYGSYLAACVAYGAFALAAEQFGRRAFGQRGVGLLSALLISHFMGFRGELVSGRDRPLVLFELALLGSLLLGLEHASRRRVALLGVVAGAMVMTRFDALPAALLVLAGAPVLGVRRGRLVLLLAGFAVAVSPWIVYSLSHFHVPFASSNRWIAISLERGDVYDYYVQRPRTLFDAPAAWIGKLLRNVRPITLALVEAVKQSVFLPVLIPLVALKAWLPGAPPESAGAPLDRRALALFVLATLAPFAGYFVTGYHEQRYFSVAIWVAELFALAYLARGGDRVFRMVIVALAVSGVLLTLVRPFVSHGRTPLESMHHQLDRSPVDTLVNCLRRAGAIPSNAVLFQMSRTLLPLPWTFGALTGWRVLPLPTNWSLLDRSEREMFMRTFRATFVVGTPVLPVEPGGLAEVPVDCPIPLHRVVSTSR